MLSEYFCLFIKFTGKTCGKSCMHEEGCSIHWKYVRKLADKQLIPCSESGCKQYTRSNSGRCSIHIRGYYTSQYYYKLRNGVVLI